MECLAARPNPAKTGPMYCNDTKDQFAELRAKGVSLSRIASDLRVPGAAWCGIWPLWSVGPRGFGWTGCWASTVSGGIMRVAVGRKPFRGAAARDGAGERREDRGGRVEAVGLEGEGVGCAAQGRPWQAGDSGTAEERDDAVDQGHCGAGATGEFQKCERAAAPVAAGPCNEEMNEQRAMKNEPYYGLTHLWVDPFTYLVG